MGKLAQSAQEIIREIDSLKLTISNKDRLISKLKQHITDICGQLPAGYCDGINAGDHSNLAGELEKIQEETSRRKATVKTLELTLDQLHITDNIDVCIHQA